MDVSERQWFRLHTRLIEVLGPEEAATLMTLLRPAHLENLRQANERQGSGASPFVVRLDSLERRAEIIESEVGQLRAAPSSDRDDRGEGRVVGFQTAEAIEILVALEHAEEAITRAGPSALMIEVQDAAYLVARRLFPDLPESRGGRHEHSR